MLKGLVPSLLVFAALVAIFVVVVSAQGPSAATTANALQISAAEPQAAPSGCLGVDCSDAEAAGLFPPICPPFCGPIFLPTPTPTFGLFIDPCIIFGNCPTPTPTFGFIIDPCIIFDSCPTPTPTFGFIIDPCIVFDNCPTPTPTPTDTPPVLKKIPTDTPTSTAAAEATDTPIPPKGSIPGDVDCSGSVNAIDAAFILQLGAGLIDELPCPEKADVNEDGTVNAIDATLILQFSAGFFKSLPI